MNNFFLILSININNFIYKILIILKKMSTSIIETEDKSTMTDFETSNETFNLKEIILDKNLENSIFNLINKNSKETISNNKIKEKEFSLEYAIKEGENIWPFKIDIYNDTGKKEILNFIIKLKDIYCGEKTFKWPNLICRDFHLKNNIFKQIIMENIIKSSSVILKYYISFLLLIDSSDTKPLIEQKTAEEFGGIEKNGNWIDKIPIIKNLFCSVFTKNVHKYFYEYDPLTIYKQTNQQSSFFTTI